MGNDPETWIYYNNALAQQHGDFITLAVVVPIGWRTEIAKEMLRGVAQAQNQYNARQLDLGQTRLLNIVIANDSNEPEFSKKVAQEIIKDSNVLGVIGHNASTATLAALPEYDKAALPVISPTSTSTYLESDFFFRTLASDQFTGATLAKYAFKHQLNRVVIFYNPDSAYSKSLTEAFTEELEHRGGTVVRTVDLSDPLDAAEQISQTVLDDKAQAAVLFPNTKVASVVIELAVARHTLSQGTLPGVKEKLQLLGGDSMYNSDILINGDEAFIGLAIAVPWFTDAISSQPFVEEADQMWQGRVSWRTATSYDATQAFIATFAETDSLTRSSVQQKLKSIRLLSEQTSGARLEFSQNNELAREPIMVRVVKSDHGPPGSAVSFELIQEED